MYVKLIICAQPAQQVFQAGFVGLVCGDGKVVVLVGICALIKFISIKNLKTAEKLVYIVKGKNVSRNLNYSEKRVDTCLILW